MGLDGLVLLVLLVVGSDGAWHSAKKPHGSRPFLFYHIQKTGSALREMIAKRAEKLGVASVIPCFGNSSCLCGSNPHGDTSVYCPDRQTFSEAGIVAGHFSPQGARRLVGASEDDIDAFKAPCVMRPSVLDAAKEEVGRCVVGVTERHVASARVETGGFDVTSTCECSDETCHGIREWRRSCDIFFDRSARRSRSVVEGGPRVRPRRA